MPHSRTFAASREGHRKVQMAVPVLTKLPSKLGLASQADLYRFQFLAPASTPLAARPPFD